MDFATAVSALADVHIGHARLLHMGPEWASFTGHLRGGTIDATDALLELWAPRLLPDRLSNLLSNCVWALARGGEQADLVLPEAAELDDLWRDCLAVAYSRIYRLIAASPGRIPGGGPAAADLVEAVRLVARLESSAFAPAGRPGAGEVAPGTALLLRCAPDTGIGAYEEEARVWDRAPGNGDLPEAGLRLLALIRFLVAEETSRTPEPVWALAAGRQGGVGYIRVATLAGRPPGRPRVELALWSRYRPDLTGLEAIADRLDELLAPAPVPDRYRVAFNPPGEPGSRQGHIRAVRPAGSSTDFALALAAYAASKRAALGRFAVTGRITPDLQIASVSGLEEKLKRLAAYNRGAVRPVTHVLAAEADVDGRLRRQARRFGLQLNVTLKGRVSVTTLRDVLQPGILFDAMGAYAENLVATYGPRARALREAPEPEGPGQDAPEALARGEADAVLQQLAASAMLAPADARAFLLAAPWVPGPEPLRAYLIYTLAHRRAVWARKLGRGADQQILAHKPPAPVVLEPSDLAGGFEVAVIQAVASVLGNDDLIPYTRESWRHLRNEFVILMHGPDDLVSHHITGEGDFLDQVQGPGQAQDGRHFLVLVANGIEQMQRWARDLELVGEQLDHPVGSWYQ